VDPDLDLPTPTEFDMVTATLRLMAALGLAALLGFERERHERASGLRTYMLVSLASALLILIAIAIGQTVTVDDRVVTDPLRVIEAVTAGVAFLAAGTIIATKGEVKGITTAAGMWLAGALGMACGAGYFLPALLTALLALFTLTVVRRFESWIGFKERRDRDGPAERE
jgi:putative Mg2+ transporter-C (MgtC) family protein